jgi:hypothetical protein
VFETSAGPEAQKTYDLNKAPVESILRVTGTSGGDSTIFVAEADFTLSADGNRLVWEDDPANEPDPGSIFFVNYTTDSIISRYLDASEEQFDVIISKVDESLSSKLVDSATGDDLDEIGKLFGPIIGRRTGRSDTEYRVYLKSVVQSFISRGTLGGIKGAIAAATIVGPEDISVQEFFDDNEFSVSISLEAEAEFGNVITGSVIEDVADLAAPSGVRLRLVKFAPEDAQEEIAISDAPEVRDAINTADQMSAADLAAFDRRGLFDAITSADAFAIDPNQTTTADTLLSADAFAIDPNQTTTSDTQLDADAVFIDPNQTPLSDDMVVDDTTAVGGFNRRDISEVTTIDDTAISRRRGTADVATLDDASVVDTLSIYRQRWEENDNDGDLRWSMFSWTELEDFVRTPLDTLVSDDGVQVDPNVSTTSDTQLSADSLAISPNVASVTSVAFADDVTVIETQVGGGVNKTIVDELFSVDDTVFVGGINNPSPQEGVGIDAEVFVGGINNPSPVEITTVDDPVTVGGIDNPEPQESVTVAETSLADERDVFDQIWEPNDTTATDIRWGFFSWTELEDLPDETAINTMFVDDAVVVDANKPSVADAMHVDDAVDIPTPTTTAEGVNADDTQLLDEAIVIWGLDDWGSLQWAVEQ